MRAGGAFAPAIILSGFLQGLDPASGRRPADYDGMIMRRIA